MAAVIIDSGVSTKHTDSTTGLVDYGYRLYSSSLGRWLNRDPLQERGGLNLYAFLTNSPPNALEGLGLAGQKIKVSIAS